MRVCCKYYSDLTLRAQARSKGIVKVLQFKATVWPKIASESTYEAQKFQNSHVLGDGTIYVIIQASSQQTGTLRHAVVLALPHLTLPLLGEHPPDPPAFCTASGLIKAGRGLGTRVSTRKRSVPTLCPGIGFVLATPLYKTRCVLKMIDVVNA